jgi:uncharacterized cupin superfamily protein
MSTPATPPERRHPQIVNRDELPVQTVAQGDRYAHGRTGFTVPAGGRALGCSLYRVPSGKTAWPRHFHYGNEEAIYILAGEGRLRLGDGEYPVRPGDYIALPANERALAHQLWALGPDPLEYLCVSTMAAPDIGEYPDSDKLGVFGGVAPGGDRAARTLYDFYRKSAQVDYYDGE